MFHQPYVNQPSIPPAPPPAPSPPQLNLTHIPQQLQRAGLEYDSFLQQLTFNSKDVITSLTQIAGENLPYAEAIVTVVEQRAYHAPAHQKLPFLYLIDSIVKNIGGKYITCFAVNLYHTFINAYAVASGETRMSMHRLLNTWPPIFGLDVVTAMRRSATDHDAQTPAQQPLPPQQPISHSLRLPQNMQQPRAFNYPSNPRMQQPAIHPPNMQPPLPMQRQQTGMQPMAQSNLQQAIQQPPPRQPPPGVPQQPGPQISGPMPRSVPLSQMPPSQGPPMLQSQPGVMPRVPGQPAVVPPAPGQVTGPRITSEPVEQQVTKTLPPQFVEVQNTMQGISRKAAMGVHPSSHQVFTMNRLITQQLQSNPPPFQRDALLRYQQQLREICSKPRQTPPAPQQPYSSSAAPAPAPTSSHVPSIAVSAALTGLLRSMPPGLLSKTQPHTVPQQHTPSMKPQSNSAPPTTEMLRSDPPMPRRPDMGTPVFQRPLPSALKFADLKGMSHAAAVRALYTELPQLSKSDGMRFATKEELREHLDWLFHQNRRKRGKAPNVVVGGSSRGWYEHLDVFLGSRPGSGDDSVKKPSPPPVNANLSDSKGLSDQQTSGSSGTKDRTFSVTESKGENELCAACNEAFESFWDDDRQAWMLRGAERTDEGEVFHTRCIEMIEADEKQKQASTTDYADTEQLSEQSPYLVSSGVKLESVPSGVSATPTAPEIIPVPKVADSDLLKVEAKVEVENVPQDMGKEQGAMNMLQRGSGQKRKREEVEETTIEEGNLSETLEKNASCETVGDSKSSQITEAEYDTNTTLVMSPTVEGERPGKKAKVEEEVLDGADATIAPAQ